MYCLYWTSAGTVKGIFINYKNTKLALYINPLTADVSGTVLRQVLLTCECCVLSNIFGFHTISL